MRSTRRLISKLHIFMFHYFASGSVHSLSCYAQPVLVFSVAALVIEQHTGVWGGSRLQIIKVIFIGWSSASKGISGSWNCVA